MPQVPIACLADAALAAFVSSYIDYRPLAQPYMLPDRVQCAAATLALRQGSCIDMALLLCSLLLGQGMEAFVVIGYAPADVLHNVQTGQRCRGPAAARRREIQKLVQEFLSSFEHRGQTLESPMQGALRHAAAPEAGAGAADGQAAAESTAKAGAPAVTEATPAPETVAAVTAGTASDVLQLPAAGSESAGDAAGRVGSADKEAAHSDAVGGDSGNGAEGRLLASTQAVVAEADGAAAAELQSSSSPTKGACPYHLNAWVLVDQVRRP